MSKPKEVLFTADRITYVRFERESRYFPSKIAKAFIVFYVDGKKYKLTVSCNQPKT